MTEQEYFRSRRARRAHPDRKTLTRRRALLITALLRTALKNKYVQAILRGLKPCVIGIVLATGIHMILRNCLGSLLAPQISIRAILITLLLVGIRLFYQKGTKKKLSPILLILLAAVLGAGIYGI